MSLPAAPAGPPELGAASLPACAAALTSVPRAWPPASAAPAVRSLSSSSSSSSSAPGTPDPGLSESKAAGGSAGAPGVDRELFRHYADEAWLRAYLASRAPLPVNSNPFFLMEGDASPGSRSQATRAASIVRSALAFDMAIRTGTLPPDAFRGKPLCMAQYQKMFRTCRVPGLDMDVSRSYSGSRHLAVMARGHVFAVDVLSACGTRASSVASMAAAFNRILDEARSLPHAAAAGSAIGVLTCEDRTAWARCRERLVASGNEASLEAIESAILLVCLDEDHPATISEEAATCLHGTSRVDAAGSQTGSCVNRWHDKATSVIVSSGGAAGINFEHSHLDGHTILRLASDVVTESLMSFARSINPSLPGVLPHMPEAKDVSCAPRRLDWSLDAGLRSAVRSAEARIADVVSRVAIAALEFGRFGKDGITSRGCSPDGFVQLAIQLAYFSVYGELACTYETAMTKAFAHGRTEPIRAARPSALAFAKAFGEPGDALHAHSGASAAASPAAAGVALPADPAEAAARLRAALAEQTAQTRKASSGKGGERQLFAIQMLAAEMGGGLPRVLQSEAWRTLNEVIISTSNCGNPSLRLFGFGNVAANGFGIGYLIKKEALVFCVTSQRRDARRFAVALERALVRMAAVLDAAPAA
mmetsp:Transcript_19343/g.74185  ORF Transcript_19343/g.74185 Transcript_19343/m.74185 type:complete len:647 (-) Transcript_19343:1127-3067(-)